MAKKIGFIPEPTQTERLFSLLIDENYKLRNNLNATEHELLNTKKQLNNARGQLSQMGVDVSGLGVEVEDTREGLMETYEVTINNETDIEDCRTAIIELYELMEG